MVFSIIKGRGLKLGRGFFKIQLNISGVIWDGVLTDLRNVQITGFVNVIADGERE